MGIFNFTNSLKILKNVPKVNEEKREYHQLQIEKRSEPPESFTLWEDFGFKDAVDQGSCGSCWAFPVTGAIEALYKVEGGLVFFSSSL